MLFVARACILYNAEGGRVRPLEARPRGSRTVPAVAVPAATLSRYAQRMGTKTPTTNLRWGRPGAARSNNAACGLHAAASLRPAVGLHGESSSSSRLLSASPDPPNRSLCAVASQTALWSARVSRPRDFNQGLPPLASGLAWPGPGAFHARHFRC